MSNKHRLLQLDVRYIRPYWPGNERRGIDTGGCTGNTSEALSEALRTWCRANHILLRVDPRLNMAMVWLALQLEKHPHPTQIAVSNRIADDQALGPPAPNPRPPH